MTSTTATPSSSSPPDPFAEADLTWELERLYQDLATVKGQPLRNTEKRYLRGLLCGYGPEELAKKVYRQPKSLTSYLSRTLYQYIKELTGHEKLQNHGQVSDWLEKYKRPQKSLRSQLGSKFDGVLSIKSVSIEGVFNLRDCSIFIDSQNNLKIVSNPDHFHLEASVSEKPKGKKE